VIFAAQGTVGNERIGAERHQPCGCAQAEIHQAMASRHAQLLAPQASPQVAEATYEQGAQIEQSDFLGAAAAVTRRCKIGGEALLGAALPLPGMDPGAHSACGRNMAGKRRHQERERKAPLRGSQPGAPAPQKPARPGLPVAMPFDDCHRSIGGFPGCARWSVSWYSGVFRSRRDRSSIDLR